MEQSNDFLRHLPGASWIAVDLEMTGIQVPNSKRPSKEEPPSERYRNSLKEVPERYSIIQLGICLFHQAGTVETEAANGAQFMVRKYKFMLFPPAGDRYTPSREVTLNPSAIHFLKENNMNFDTWVTSGIPFVVKETATAAADFFVKKHKTIRNWKPQEAVAWSDRKGVVLTREEDKQFHARAMASLREWLDAPIPNQCRTADGSSVPVTEGISILLPQCNTFLRRALYESIGRDYPYLVTETHQERIRVWRLTPVELKQRNERMLREGFEELIQEKVGAYRIFLALTKACRGEPITTRAEQILMSPHAGEWMLEDQVAGTVPGNFPFNALPKPIVVHNGLMDMLFLLTHFHAPTLPDDWAECKALIHSYFPILYDTKCMASQYSMREHPRARTHLASVYEQAIASNPQWELVFQSGTGQDDQAHDAAFDAYMTGVAFCGLSFTIQDQCKVPPVQTSTRFALWDWVLDLEFPKSLYGCNKLFFFASPYVIDLESPGPTDPFRKGFSPISCFRMTGFDKSVNNSDINRCLSSLTDSNNNRISYETMWVDDDTVVIAVLIREFHHNEDLFKEQGKIVKEALQSSFGKAVTIGLLTSAFAKEENRKRSFWNLWGLLGSTSEPAKVDDMDERPGKRRRIR